MSVDDYSWWRAWRPAWAEAHCVTLVGDVTVDDVLDSLRANPVTQAHGFDAFHDHVVADWPDGYDPSRAVVGVATVDDTWTLVANVNAVHTLHWWHDGQLLVDVDLMFPAERTGADPEAVVEHILGVGIPLDADPEELATIDLSAAGFALAQRITGVACTPQLFERSDVVVATVAS